MKRRKRPEKSGAQYPVAFLYSRSRFAMGREIVYDYYQCSDEEVAKRFLESAANPERFHYVVVITSEGAIGRDNEGIYYVKEVTPGIKQF